MSLDRRSILKLVAALSFGPISSIADEQKSTVHLVEAVTDRTGQPHKAARANSRAPAEKLGLELIPVKE